jgi:restriction system protein
MWVIVLLFITLAAITLWLKTPTGKGQFGEFCVNVGMKLFLDDRYHLIKNVTLPSGDGTTQIDHVIVSAYGVFVVETKNMNGGIYGSEHDKLWTQALGGKKFRFQNPLRQNYKHTQVLAEVLGVPHEKIVSIIMFIGDGKLKTQDRLPANVMSMTCPHFLVQFQ